MRWEVGRENGVYGLRRRSGGDVAEGWCWKER